MLSKQAKYQVWTTPNDERMASLRRTPCIFSLCTTKPINLHL
jgi:hypothetical protein